MTVRYHQRAARPSPITSVRTSRSTRATSSTLPDRSPALPSTMRSPRCCSTRSRRSRSRSHSASPQSSTNAPKRPTQLRRTHVERARYEAELARRRYLAVDPDNRLVADTLEADWNEKLRSLAQAQDDYEHARNNGNGRLSDEQRAKVMALASDFPRLWNDPATPQRERKRMVRLLDRRRHPQPRPADHRARTPQRRPDTHAHAAAPTSGAGRPARSIPTRSRLIDELLDDHTDAHTAELLNQAGRRTGTGQPFTLRASWSISAATTDFPATATGSAHAGCSRSQRSPSSSACAPAQSRPGAPPAC